MELINSTGTTVSSQLLTGNAQTVTADISGIASGSYTMIIYTEDNLSVARKIIKIK
jgi:hypothetical protein